MSVLAKGKGKRTTSRMVVESVSVGARREKGLSITFYGKDDHRVNVALDTEHADNLRSLIKTVDEMGQTLETLQKANERLASPHLDALIHARNAINELEEVCSKVEQEEPDSRGAWAAAVMAVDAAEKCEAKVRPQEAARVEGSKHT